MSKGISEVKVVLQPGKRVEGVNTWLAQGWRLLNILPAGDDGRGKVMIAYVMGREEGRSATRYVAVKTIKNPVGVGADSVNDYIAGGWEIISATAVTDESGDYVIYILGRKESGSQPAAEFSGGGGSGMII
jgi:hypothetical protein